MAEIISGKILAAKIKAEAAQQAAQLALQGVQPKLTVLIIGDNPASKTYVKGKAKDCAECKIESEVIALPEDVSEETVLELIGKLNADPAVHGILVQLPLPEQIHEQRVIDAISPEKDVDGFTTVNVGRLMIGMDCFLPCTPAGCIEMLHAAGIEICGKNAVVIGRSNIVGKPAAVLLTENNATVTVCHSATKNLAGICAGADILIAAVGKPGFVTANMVKEGAVVIDVGINRNAEGKLCGDVAFDEVAPKAAFITPVPGGVGLMTRAMLMKNTIRAAKLQAGH